MGASIEDAESASVISEQSGRSSIADRFSPSGSVEALRNYRSMETPSDNSHMRPGAQNFPQSQISPIEMQKNMSGIYRQRFMVRGFKK